MLDSDGEESIIFYCLLFAVAVKIVHFGVSETLDILVDTGDAEATLLIECRASFVNDDRVDHLQCILFGLIDFALFHFERHIDDQYPKRDSDLYRSEPDAVFGNHRIIHIIEQLVQLLVKGLYLFRDHFEPFVRIDDNLSYHLAAC